MEKKTKMEKEKALQSGTTTLAIVCKDGIVLGADRRSAFFGGFVTYKRAKKILPITDWIVVTTAGVVSDIELLVKIIKAELKLKELQTNRAPNVKEAANLLAGLNYEIFRAPTLIPGIASFLIAGKDESGFHAYSVGPDGSLLEILDFAADGSGEVFVLGVLETIYKKDISVEEGVKIALKALNAAIERDLHSGNGIDIVTITNKGIQTVVEKEIKIQL